MDREKAFLWIFMIWICVFMFGSAWGVPGIINYQGKLMDNLGKPLAGTYTMHFYLYDALSGGTLLWDEEQSVAVTDGIYDVPLGAVNAPDAAVFTGNEVYLEVAIYNAGTTSWETLSPRQRFTSTAYAFQAENAMTLEGHTGNEFAPVVHEHSGSDITSGTIDEARIDPAIARDSEMTWNNLSGIPSDIADGDQVGIITETDPTVAASVKDGVSWGELSGIPAGFADGVDNDSGGDITGVTAGTGLSGGGNFGGVTLNVDVPFSLTGSVSGGLISATNNDASGYGVYGSASNTGDVVNFGGYFKASGTSGRGVLAWSSGTSGMGVYGYATGTSGRGVFGYALNGGDVRNYGGYFQANGIQGYGVYGYGIQYDFYAAGPGINYGYASSIRWKKNIKEIGGALDKVLSLKGVYFDWDEEHGGQHDMGFIAEEVGKVIPEIVAFEPEGVYATGVDYGAITPVLVQAIKEQQQLIDEQQEQILELKTEIEALKKKL